MSVSFEAITVPGVRSTRTAWLPVHFLLHPSELGLDAGVGTLFAPWVTVMGGEENGEEVEVEEEGEE